MKSGARVIQHCINENLEIAETKSGCFGLVNDGQCSRNNGVKGLSRALAL